MIGVHLRQISSEGLRVEGGEDASFLELDGIEQKATGPVGYSLDAGISGGGVFATGRVWVPMELRCVACLRPFRFMAESDSFAAQVEIDGREFVDFSPFVREELLLALPNHPRCDLNGGLHCPYQRPEGSGGGNRRATKSAWDQLDKFKPER